MFKQNRKKLIGRKMEKGGKKARKTFGVCPDFPLNYKSQTLEFHFSLFMLTS